MDDIETLILAIVGVVVFSFVASIVNMLRISRLNDEVRFLRRQIEARDFIHAPVAAEKPETEPEQIDSFPVELGLPVEAAQEPDAPAAPSKATATNDTIESKIGGRWTVWLGGLTLALGGLFLVNYAIESGLLSPAIRLSLAALFGLALAGGGEYLRRKAKGNVEAVANSTSIPGLLTAAGAITLFGTIFVAHDIYGYFGSTIAFILLAITALATIAIASLHGQSIAGLGLIGAMLAPALVASEDPSAPILFGYLGITGASAIWASKKPRWTLVPALAYIGLFLWAVLFVGAADIVDPLPPAAAFLMLLAATIALWPANDTIDADSSQPTSRFALIKRAPLGLSLTLSIVTVLAALIYLMAGASFVFSPYYFAVCLIIGLAALGSSRRFAVIPAIFAAGGAISAVVIQGPLLEQLTGDFPLMFTPASDLALTLILSLAFMLCGLGFFKKHAANDMPFAYLWAAIIALVPAWLAALSFAYYGTYSFDITHFLFGATLGLTALYVADHFAAQDDASAKLAVNALVLASFLGFSLSLHTVSAALATTLLVPILGYLYFLSARYRTWAALPWMMVPAILITIARFAWEPTIVGADRLWTTPIFNQLLPAYGLPAALTLLAAYQSRGTLDLKLKNTLQGLGALLTLVFAAVMIRHTMNGGTLTGGTITLGEQSLYSLLLIGLSIVMLLLDRRDTSLALRYGSIFVSLVSIAVVLISHLWVLNPYFTGELTGNWPIFNVILLGYLLPALGYALLASMAGSSRPRAYVRLVSAASALMAFIWVSLEVRHFWQGSNIADWKGFLPAETYSYTVVWLLLGVALLVLGIKREALVLRLASALLLVLATAKAFLFDMSNLDGALRALSFIGLGLVLMGIGLFYQKLLSKPKAGLSDESDVAGA